MTRRTSGQTFPTGAELVRETHRPRAENGSLGGSLWEFQPGGSQFVYHFHHGSEELIIVLRGKPTVRLHDGDRHLHEGDVVPLPEGPRGWPSDSQRHVRDGADLDHLDERFSRRSPAPGDRQDRVRVGGSRVGIPPKRGCSPACWPREASRKPTISGATSEPRRLETIWFGYADNHLVRQASRKASMTTYQVGYFVGSLSSTSINRDLSKR